MKSLIVKILFVCCFICVNNKSFAIDALVHSNPGELVLMETAYNQLGKLHNDEKEIQIEIGSYNAAIAGEFNYIASWQNKYNHYLSKAKEYGSALRAICTLALDIYRTWYTIMDIKHTIETYPEGMVSSFVTTDIWIQTAAELLVLFDAFQTIAPEKNEEGKRQWSNMLSKAARSEFLWEVVDRYARFHKRLKRLAYTLKVCSFSILWDKIQMQAYRHNPGKIAMIRYKARQKRIENLSRFEHNKSPI